MPAYLLILSLISALLLADHDPILTKYSRLVYADSHHEVTKLAPMVSTEHNNPETRLKCGGNVSTVFQIEAQVRRLPSVGKDHDASSTSGHGSKFIKCSKHSFNSSPNSEVQTRVHTLVRLWSRMTFSA